MSQHVLITGGGIVGCLTAMELTSRGCQVTIVERNQIASQTSGESSWAGAGIMFPLLPWMYSEHVNTLTSRGAAQYPQICERLLAETIDPVPWFAEVVRRLLAGERPADIRSWGELAGRREI